MGGRVMRDGILRIITEHDSMIRDMLDENLISTLEDITKRMVTCYRNGGKVIIFGNGGSAADAQHIVGELINKLNIDRPMLNAIALTVNTSVLTAIANDVSYDMVFARQIESFADKRDVVIGISTSGKAENVLNGLREAKKLGATVIYFTGMDGGKIRDANKRENIIDVTLNIPSNKTQRVQEAHILAGHIICELVEHELYG
jgi:D-sedoheptulose 7-phosphate isomerase